MADFMKSLFQFGVLLFVIFLVLQFTSYRNEAIPQDAEFVFVETPEIYKADDQIPVKLAYKDRKDGVVYNDFTSQPSMTTIRLVLDNTKACSLNENRSDQSTDATHTVYISCDKNLNEPIKLYAHYRNKVISITYVPQGQGLLAQQR